MHTGKDFWNLIYVEFIRQYDTLKFFIEPVWETRERKSNTLHSQRLLTMIIIIHKTCETEYYSNKGHKRDRNGTAN